ncbi:spore maturation protein B [Clostridium acetireducens DSM 10703]|uniref:Spore maturation protein B n=1 Tax=Clostridium acetireducens DSM 10703 TaxID=1121290 RepID=A0A1E8EXJ3_9CLOT|nr:nucleoside recognition domain-containing protein [Clostridium acetireducens]OFI05508.1 spore maturation protein B [Clostridium acetireducens DSM 10703]
MGYIAKSIVCIIVISIIFYGFINNVKVYECFIEGAKEGLYVCIKIFPYLLAMIVAVSVLRESNVLNLLITLFKPIFDLLGIPSELLPLILIKPLSGSGSLGVYTDILKNYGVDTNIGMLASIIMGSTETIFYTLSVYYGSVGIKKIRHTLWAAIIADIVAIITAANIFKFFV